MDNQLPLFVKDKNGLTHYLTGVIGQGGQGMVCSTRSEDIVVKLLCKNGTPIRDEKLSVAYSNNIEKSMVVFIPDGVNVCYAGSIIESPYSGYVMRMMDSEKMSPLSKIKENGIESINLKKRLEILIELSRSLAVLHSNGIVYCDLSLNNVYTSLEYESYSKVWLIDSDNIRYSSDVESGIYTPGYGAPEIVSKYSVNTIYSDMYSFAVIAFELLIGIPPMVMDVSDESSSGGWDDSNASGSDDYSECNFIYVGDESFAGCEEARKRMSERLTKKIVSFFDQVFSKDTVNDFTNRTRMHEWYSALIAMYSLLVKEGDQYTLVKSSNKAKSYDMFLVQESFSDAYIADYVKTNEELLDFSLFEVDGKNEKEELVSYLKAKSYSLIANSLLYDGKVVYSFECETPCVTNVPEVVFVASKNADGSLKLINKKGIRLAAGNSGYKAVNFTVSSGGGAVLKEEHDENEKCMYRRFCLRVSKNG